MAGNGSVLVPKGPRAEPRAGHFDKDRLIEELFSLPLPPNPTGTRTYPTDTVLGRIMRLRGLSVVEVSRLPNGPSARQIGDHLAKRRRMRAEHLNAVALGLRIDRRLLD